MNKRMTESIEFLWANRKKYQEKMKGNPHLFDFPDYGNLPKRLSYKFSPEEVDSIQYCWEQLCGWSLFDKPLLKFKNKKAFQTSVKRRLEEIS